MILVARPDIVNFNIIPLITSKGVEAMNLKKGLFERRSEPFRVLHQEERAAQDLSVQLSSMLPTYYRTRPIVFVCIGTDRSTGDSLGPLVGTLIEEDRKSVV